MTATALDQQPKSVFRARTRASYTLSDSLNFSGMGVFTGQKSSITLHPAKENHGVVFRRIDLDGQPLIPAKCDYLKGTARCTILEKDGIHIQTVEHLLSALRAYCIDNVLIDIDGSEPPIMDGSSKAFCEGFEKVGLKQVGEIEDYLLQTPVALSDKDMHIVALPSEELKVSYTLAYEGHPMLSSQFHEFICSKEGYIEQIAPCRTFVLYEEVKKLIEMGLIKGANLDHGVVVDGDKVLNEDGKRFENEMARHKILDLIGDLSLTKKPVIAHFIAVKSGHFLNTTLAKKIDQMMEQK